MELEQTIQNETSFLQKEKSFLIKRASTYALASFLTAFTPGCAPDDNQGCQVDNDCKGEMVCEGGECVEEEEPQRTCYHEDCSEGQKECLPYSEENPYTYHFRECGDYDNDSCFEWGEKTSCDLGEYCQNDRCTPISPLPGRFVFSIRDSIRDENDNEISDIYTMPANDTSSPRRLTADGCYNFNPKLSPDGTKIAFEVSYAADSSGHVYCIPGIYVMDTDGNNKRKITDGDFPAWSPNGREIAYVRQRRIQIINIDGTNERSITDELNYASLPSFSPDGAKIVFNSGNDIYKINVDGTDLRRLTFNPDNENYYPSFSPDGSQIIFGCLENYNYDICLMNSDGSNRRNITNSREVGENFPIWSPNGTRIGFNRGSGGITVMKLDGTEATKIYSGNYGMFDWGN